MLCAIHQPNFFPWLGYFDKIKKADIFIFLDAVAYPKSGSGSGSWVNRVRLAIQGQSRWVGCPIRRQSGIQLIKDVEIDKQQPWRDKLLKTLAMNYSRAKNYQTTMQLLEPLILNNTDNLAQFNIDAIRKISDVMGLQTRFVLQSELSVTGRATELLINLTKAVQADTYLCGGGAEGYQQDELFATSGIQLVYQNFKPQPYNKSASFIPGLSVIDYLMQEEK